MSEQWPLKPLGEICEILDKLRKPITKRDRVSGEYPYYGATGIVDYVNGYIFDEKLVLIGEDGAKWESGENTAFSVEGKCWVNNHAHVIRPNRNIVLDNWLIYFLNMSDLTEHITGLTVPKLNQGKLKAIQIPIPPLKEQQRIVSILDEIFENIQNETVQIENKLLSAKGLFQSKLESIFNARDDNWGDFTFDEIIQSKLIGLVRNNKTQSDEYPYRYVKMNNIGNDNSFNEANIVNVQATPSEVEKFSLRNGDFLFNTRNSYELVGKICIFQSEAVAPTLFNNNIMRVRFTSEINPSFIALAFSCKGVVDQLEKMKSGTTSVVGIYYKSLRELKIHIPSLSEQNAIVDSLGLLMSKTQSLKEIYQSNLDSYSKLKQSILQEAFDGKLKGGIAA